MEWLRCYILCPQACADPAELELAFSQVQLVERRFDSKSLRDA